jgi:sugar phosphate permease
MMSEHSKLTSWRMWFLAVSFYFYQFIIRVATSNLREPLTLEYNLTASDFGLFASYWLISYALLQIPMGIALDKWGVRRIFSLSALTCGIGTFIMASTENFGFLCFARLLIGAGSTAGFIGTFKVSSEWFSERMLPILVGIISGIGVLGASLAGAPMVILQNAIGWRTVFYLLSATAVVLSVVYILFLRDKQLRSHINFKEIRTQLFKLIKEPQIWLLGCVGFILYTPVSVLADLWGSSFISTAYGYSAVESAFASSFVYYGNASIAFLIGWLYFKFSSNKQFFVFFSILATVCMAILVWADLPNYLMLCVSLFALGCMVGSENLIFPISDRYAAEGYQGLSASVINFIVMVGPIALQPGIGIVMDLLWDGSMVDGVPTYSPEQYRIGLSSLIVALIVGVVLSFWLKGKPVTDKK